MKVKKILIVEDEILIGRVLKMVLERRGFEVLHVTNAKAVYEKYKELAPSFVILDVSLNHDTNGVDIARELRNNKCDCPIIFTTGNSYKQTQEQIKDIPNTYLFIKPIDSESIADFINKL